MIQTSTRAKMKDLSKSFGEPFLAPAVKGLKQNIYKLTTGCLP